MDTLENLCSIGELYAQRAPQLTTYQHTVNEAVQALDTLRDLEQSEAALVADTSLASQDERVGSIAQQLKHAQIAHYNIEQDRSDLHKDITGEQQNQLLLNKYLVGYAIYCYRLAKIVKDPAQNGPAIAGIATSPFFNSRPRRLSPWRLELATYLETMGDLCTDFADAVTASLIRQSAPETNLPVSVYDDAKFLDENRTSRLISLLLSNPLMSTQQPTADEYNPLLTVYASYMQRDSEFFKEPPAQVEEPREPNDSTDKKYFAQTIRHLREEALCFDIVNGWNSWALEATAQASPTTDMRP